MHRKLQGRPLVVELFDTKTKQLLWRGSSHDTLSSSSNKNSKNWISAWRKCSNKSLQIHQKSSGPLPFGRP